VKAGFEIAPLMHIDRNTASLSFLSLSGEALARALFLRLLLPRAGR